MVGVDDGFVCWLCGSDERDCLMVCINKGSNISGLSVCFSAL